MEKFVKDEIVPDVIRAAPTAKMTVKWDGKELEPGAEWTPTQVQNQPEIEWEAEKDALYTLIMTDPDVPSRAEPKGREFLHWMVINIPGCDINKGEVFAQYVGCGAPKGTGLHRYVFVAFKQKGIIHPDMQKDPGYTIALRKPFKTQNFVDKNNLGVVVAGNFFLGQYDDYVPKLHAKFSYKA